MKACKVRNNTTLLPNKFIEIIRREREKISTLNHISKNVASFVFHQAPYTILLDHLKEYHATTKKSYMPKF